jgi:phosphoglycolate phosphatase-like HAD superfamily hydrolase
MDAVIGDMDGTICDVRSIRHHIMGATRNFHAFHTESVNCPPNLAVVEALKKDHENGLAVLIVTAREFRFAFHTMFYLSGPEVNLPYEQMYMRRNGDYRPDYEVKRDILDMIRADGYNPVKAYDDNPNVWDVWEAAGIETVRVEGYGFD